MEGKLHPGGPPKRRFTDAFKANYTRFMAIAVEDYPTTDNVTDHATSALYLKDISEFRVQPTIRRNRKRKNAVEEDNDYIYDDINDDDNDVY